MTAAKRTTFWLMVVALFLAAGCTGKTERNRVDEHTLSEFGQKKAESDAKKTGLGTRSEVGNEGPSMFTFGDDEGGGLLSGGGSRRATKEEMRARILFASALDVVLELPVTVSDQSGGFISTDWKTNPSDPTTRYRLNIKISGKEPYGEVKVVVLKQNLVGGNWKDNPADAALAAQIEKAIRKRALSANDKTAEKAK